MVISRKRQQEVMDLIKENRNLRQSIHDYRISKEYDRMVDCSNRLDMNSQDLELKVSNWLYLAEWSFEQATTS